MNLTQKRIFALAALLSFGAFAAPAGAATISVGCTTPAAELSLAIDTANADVAPDTLNLAPACAYAIPNPPADTNHNWYGPSGLPAISSDITIEGNGSTIS